MKRRWWLSGLRLGLGIIFIIAGVSKLSALSLFINEVAAYGFLPDALARVYGMALPWVELAAGCSLVLGVFTTLALVFSILMTASFIIASIYALYRGVSDTCGCFGQLIPLSHTASLIIAALMIVTAAGLLLYRKKITFIGIDTLVSRLGSTIPETAKYLAPKISQFILLAVIVLATGLPLSSCETRSPVYSEIDRSLEQGKLVYLYFYLEGCGECEKQKPVIDDLEQVYQDSVTFIRIDYEAEASVAANFEVTGVPAMLLIVGKNDSGYTVLQRFPRLASKESLQRSLYEGPAARIICNKYGPLAEFSASPVSGYIPAKVQFTDSSLGDIDSWAWDFDNDGSVDSTLQHPSYMYSNPGNYTVRLTVSGPCGSRTEIKQEYLIFTSKGCRADFTAEPTKVDGVAPIQFSDKSEGDIVAWEWDFNSDGKVDSKKRNPTYTYATNGEYSVTLTVKTADCEDTLTKQKYIQVTGCGG